MPKSTKECRAGCEVYADWKELEAASARLVSENRFKPVSEGLPKEGVAVLVKMESGYIGKCTIIDNEWQHLGEDVVTHWMPIPKEKI